MTMMNLIVVVLAKKKMTTILKQRREDSMNDWMQLKLVLKLLE